MDRKRGFTLIELIIIVAILGILAAIAIPRYLKAQRHARIAVVEALAGGVKSAVSIVQAHCILNPTECRGGSVVTIHMNGTPVDIITANHYPTNSARGIGAAIDVSGMTATYSGDPVVGSTTFIPRGGGANCQVVYSPSAGTVTPIISDCS